MLASEFEFELPKELIAQIPVHERTESRMLVLDRRNVTSELKNFTDFPSYVKAGDCVVINDTKVIPARLYGNKIKGGGRVEALLTEEIEPGLWKALIRPVKRIKIGTQVSFTASKTDLFQIKQRIDERTFVIEFSTSDVLKLLRIYGQIPLPPYIRRKPNINDISRYQTIYATQAGSIAAPTAGLHFDHRTLQQIKNKNVRIARVTLHIGLGTFTPVAVENIENHTMHSELYLVPEETANLINSTKANNGSVVAIGTSVVRALETCSDHKGQIKPGSGITNLFLYPPRKPKVIDKLLTNFHLPKSTLLMLVCIFAPRETVLRAYQLAVRERFRFYSYGDCMLLT